MSDIKYYRDLLKQRTRIEAFQRAISAVVRPGDRVLEVGAGLGTFAFFAADAGAARVWAVEGNPVVHVARAIAALNGYRGRVELIRGWVPSVQLPERADVLIFEDFPPRLLDARTFRLLRWVHESYMVDTPRAVPTAATVHVAPVSSGRVWEDVDLVAGGERAYGIDWQPSREYLVNAPLAVRLDAEDLVGEPAALGVMRFDRAPRLDAIRGRGKWEMSRPCTVHGIGYWFELDLGGGLALSNRPGAAPGSWGQLFLPLEDPLALVAGQELAVEVEAHHLPDGSPGWLSWLVTGRGVAQRGYELAGVPAALAEFEAASPDFVPQLDGPGRLEALVLQLTNGSRTVHDIAMEIRGVGNRLTEREAERLVVEILRNRILLEDASAVAAREGA